MKEIWELHMFEKDLVHVSEVHFRNKFICDLKEIKIANVKQEEWEIREHTTITNKNDLVKDFKDRKKCHSKISILLVIKRKSTL